MKLITNQIDEQDPQWIDYIKTTDNPTWLGYQMYCGELFKKEVSAALEKYEERNEKFIENIGHTDTYSWLINYMRNQPASIAREEVGYAAFNSYLHLMANYNSLWIDLSGDELDEEEIKAILEEMKDIKQKIENQ